MDHATFSLAEQILERPDAVLQFRRIQEALSAEKERRQAFYEWIQEDTKAEFINGEMVIHSPVKRRHWNASTLLSRLLSLFASMHQLGTVGVEKVMISLTRNDYEPDLVFFSAEKAAAFTDDQVLFPAPDLVVEITSRKTAAIDRGIKRQDYALHGIREYWIVDPAKMRIEQYILPSGADAYFPAKIHQYGHVISSHAIPGFAIPVEAVFEEMANMAALQALLKMKP